MSKKKKPAFAWPEGMPREIRLGHVCYSVHVDPSEVNMQERPDGELMAGHTEPALRRIFINTDGFKLEQQQNTLLHEVLHCCINFSGVHVLGDPEETEEVFVNAMGTPLHGALLQNPGMVAWLTRQ